MKILDAYMEYGLYVQWNEAVNAAMENNNIDTDNGDLILAVCEYMEDDDTEYPITGEEDCLLYLTIAAEKAIQQIKVPNT